MIEAEVDGQGEPASGGGSQRPITVTGAVAIRQCRLLNAISHGVSLLPATSDAVVENCEIYNL